MEKEIVIKITIPEIEYKEWSDYQANGIEGAMLSIKNDVASRLRQDYVRKFDIEVYEIL